ncbi:MAG: DUF1343 domain-containing protein [Chlorobiaceae bacterium]|nr:DUF1343 domain-containing protein [Chlorobiaceae bacterium]
MISDRSSYSPQLHPEASRFCCPAALLLLLFFLFCAPPLSAEALLCGIDRLEVSGFRELSGMNVGLITNVAGVSRKGEPDYALMLRNGVKLKFIMAPEHGFSADREAGKQVGNSIINGTLPVFSLYGASKNPDIRQLKTIDTLVFDLQDIGSRCYTYISTMKSAMQACEEAGIAFMVLDRPNPVIPLSPAGFMVAKGYDSFVGAVDIPFIHSMTVGEIAILLKESNYQHLDLRVIAMSGYSRDRFADEYPDFSFMSPSPNIRGVETAIIYPATVFLEATKVSEGRGSDAPFRQFGAPFINARELSDALREYKLPGVKFDAVSFQPLSGKFTGERCQGVKLSLTDRKIFSPFRTAAAILLALQRLYPDRTALDEGHVFFDRLAGTPRFREMIRKQMSLDAIMEESRLQVESFNRNTPQRLLYH